MGIPYQRQDGGHYTIEKQMVYSIHQWTVENNFCRSKNQNVFSSFSAYIVNGSFILHSFGFNTYSENGFYAKQKWFDGNPLDYFVQQIL